LSKIDKNFSHFHEKSHKIYQVFQNFIEIDKNDPEEEDKTKIAKSRFFDLRHFFKFFFASHQILILFKNF